MTKQALIEYLFDGAVQPNAHKSPPCTEQSDIDYKINRESRRLMEELSADGQERLQKLQKLYLDSAIYSQRDGFAYGLKLGVLLLCEVFMAEDMPTDT